MLISIIIGACTYLIGILISDSYFAGWIFSGIAMIIMVAMEK